ncbi:MAG: AraC family transcriptional regulator [Bacteroidales bacterium]|nr:AraC family transcriptional regulator [Bacteroidales bacterium]
MKETLMQRLRRRMITSSARRRAEYARKALDKITAAKIRNWIETTDNLVSTATIEEIADEINISESRLSWYFKENYGMTFKTWRKTVRIEQAKRILKKSPDISIEELAYLLGGTDKSNLARQFHETTGITIYEWRRNRKR